MVRLRTGADNDLFPSTKEATSPIATGNKVPLFMPGKRPRRQAGRRGAETITR
jgi:hypothetical protein